MNGDPRVPRSPTRVFITGGNGFVGRYLIDALAGLPDPPEIVVGTFGEGSFECASKARQIALDVTDADHVQAVIAAEQPTHLFHLAAIAAVPAAQGNVRRTWA